MQELLNAFDDPRRTVKALWTTAMNAVGCDNITIALVEITSDGAEEP